MGSDQSFVGKSTSAAYGITKAAIAQLAKSTAVEFASHGIRVNCVCPGTTETPLMHHAVARYSKMSGVPVAEVQQGLATAQPIQRVAQAEEIASVVRQVID